MSTINQQSQPTLHYSRRDLGRLIVVGLAAPMLSGSMAGAGARNRLGLHTSSFRNLSRTPERDLVASLLVALAACDVHQCELSSTFIEPFANHSHTGMTTTAAKKHRPEGHHAAAVSNAPVRSGHSRHSAGAPAVMSTMNAQMMRRELRKWRLRTPVSYFRAMADRFQKAGVTVYAYDVNIDSTFTDEEIDRTFVAAKAIGAESLTASMSFDVAVRVAPLADRYGMLVALDTHRFSNTAELTTVLRLSRHYKLAVDVGQLTAENRDALSFMRDHRAQIASIRLKDCRRGSTVAIPWGQGDAPIADVLQLLEREQWPVRVSLDCPSPLPATAIEEVKRCLAFATQQLA